MNTDDEVIVANAALSGSDNYEELEQDIDPARLGDKLVQVNRKKGIQRSFQVYNNRHLLITMADLKGRTRQHYRVNLAWLSPEPTHERFVDWLWLGLTLLFGGVTAIFVTLAVMEQLTMDYAMIGGSIAGTLTLLSLMLFIYRIRDEFTFKGFCGSAALFTMENGRPTQSLFDAFFVQLQQAIERSIASYTTSERLVGELKMCRRLRDDGVIDEDAYTTTRTCIFRHEEYRA